MKKKLNNCGQRDCFWYRQSVLGVETEALFWATYGKHYWSIHPCNQCIFNEEELLQRLRESLRQNYIRKRRVKDNWLFLDGDIRIKKQVGEKYSCGYCKDGAGVPSFELHTIFIEKGNEYACVDNKQICFKCLVSLGKNGVDELKKKIQKEVEDFHNNLK